MTYRSTMFSFSFFFFFFFFFFEFLLIRLFGIILCLIRISTFFPLFGISRRDTIIISEETTRYLLTGINPLPDEWQVHHLSRLSEIVESPPFRTTIKHLQLFFEAAHPLQTSIVERPVNTFTCHFFIAKLYLSQLNSYHTL